MVRTGCYSTNGPNKAIFEFFLSLCLSVPLLLSSEPFLSYTTDLPVALKLCQPNSFLAIFFNSLKLQSDARTTS